MTVLFVVNLLNIIKFLIKKKFVLTDNCHFFDSFLSNDTKKLSYQFFLSFFEKIKKKNKNRSLSDGFCQ